MKWTTRGRSACRPDARYYIVLTFAFIGCGRVSTNNVSVFFCVINMVCDRMRPKYYEVYNIYITRAS